MSARTVGVPALRDIVKRGRVPGTLGQRLGGLYLYTIGRDGRALQRITTNLGALSADE